MSDLLPSFPLPAANAAPVSSPVTRAPSAPALTLHSPPLRVLLISDCPACRADVFHVLPPPHTVHCVGMDEAPACVAQRGSAGAGLADVDVDVLLVHWNDAGASTLAALAQRLGGTLPVLTLHNEGTPPSSLPLLVGAFAMLPLPFDPQLLSAKVLVFERIRRLFLSAAAGDPRGDGALPEVEPDEACTDKLFAGPITIDLGVYEARVDDVVLVLPPRQFDLLVHLVEHAGRLVTRDQLLERVWEIDFDVNTNVVDVYVHYLRKKLKAAGLAGAIQTVRGIGYRLSLPD